MAFGDSAVSADQEPAREGQAPQWREGPVSTWSQNTSTPLGFVSSSLSVTLILPRGGLIVCQQCASPDSCLLYINPTQQDVSVSLFILSGISHIPSRT